MKVLLRSLHKYSRRLSFRAGYFVDFYKRRILGEVSHQLRLLAHSFYVFRAKKNLQTRDGRRFLELQSLLTEYLKGRIENDPEYARLIANQLDNVLKNCDQITYQEPGTAEAYALLHFLDRYHRFQVIFASLYKNKLMPLNASGVNVLDVGTGPGPSMYAVSDFYSATLPENSNSGLGGKRLAFSIDYVERSQQFRNWLHNFTEFANYYCPSRSPWWVPFNHGSFSDFQNLEFNQPETHWDQDDDGDRVITKSIRKHRFDLIVFSNFLTTKEQVSGFSKEIEDCARFLRNNGILLVVGARSSIRKYRAVYDNISNVIVSGMYSNRYIIARCDRLDIKDSRMGYSWNDCYGERLKEFTRVVFGALQTYANDSVPEVATAVLLRAIRPEYSRAIEWEILVFRKKARPRGKTPKPAVSRTCAKMA